MVLKTVGLPLLFLGVIGYLVVPYTFLTSFVCIEMMLLGAAAYGLGVATLLDDYDGQYSFLLILTVAAAESAIGLAILVQLYRIRGDVEVVNLPMLKA